MVCFIILVIATEPLNAEVGKITNKTSKLYCSTEVFKNHVHLIPRKWPHPIYDNAGR